MTQVTPQRETLGGPSARSGDDGGDRGDELESPNPFQDPVVVGILANDACLPSFLHIKALLLLEIAS